MRQPRITFSALATACACCVACGIPAESPVAPAPAPPPTPILPRPSVEDWRTQQPKAGAQGQLSIPAPDVKTLGNGMAIYSLLRTNGTISISIVLNRGAEAALPGKTGTAALLARLLTESTRHHNAFALAEVAERFGTSLASSAQRDSLTFSLDALPDDFEPALALLSEILRQPAWSKIDFVRVRNQWLDDLQAERQAPGALASMIAMRAMFGTHKGSPVNGSMTDVAALTLDDLRSWYRAYVTPLHAALVVVGPVDPNRVIATAQKAFGEWRGEKTTDTATKYEAAARNSTQVIVADRKGAVQSSVFMAQPFPRRLLPGHEARLFLNDILGGLFTSRINTNLREKHAYTYGAHTMIIANRNFGIFAAQTSVRTDVTASALRELLSELQAITTARPQKPATELELLRSRSDLIHRLAAHLEQNRSMASDIETLFTQGLPSRYYAEAPESYSRVTLLDVTRQAEAVTPGAMTVVIVGDQGSIEPQLKAAGFTVVQPEPGWDD